MADTTAAEALIASQAAEYGAYVAVHPIDIDGVRAFNPGDPVPKGHVEGSKPIVPRDLVVHPDTKAAKAAQEG